VSVWLSAVAEGRGIKRGITRSQQSRRAGKGKCNWGCVGLQNDPTLRVFDPRVALRLVGQMGGCTARKFVFPLSFARFARMLPA
jgi:hypothetical protein